MSFETVLYARLSDSGGALYPLVSTRVYPVLRAQDCDYPAVTWQRISTVPVSAMGADASLERIRFQLDVWAETFSSGKSVADAVETQIRRWISPANDIQDIYLNDRHDEYDTDAQLFRVMFDFEAIYAG